MAAAVPFAIKAGTMLGGSLLGKKLSGPSKEQKGQLAGQQQAAQAVGQYASPLVQQGFGLARQGSADLGQAGDYYRNILSSRQSARESLAPEMSTALNFYRGAEGKTKRTMQGGSRDLALAELDRQKVGQFASMLPAARRSAAEGLTNTGGSALSGGSAFTGQGVGAASAAGNIYAGMGPTINQIEQQKQEGGKAWGSILYDAAGQMFGGKGKGGKTPAAGSPVGARLPPNFPGLPGMGGIWGSIYR